MFQSVKLHNFRNYKQETIDLHPGLNVVIGDNGRGKTNLLEALFLLIQGRSMRVTDAKEMVRKGEEEALVEGTIEREGIIKVRIQIKKEGSVRGRRRLRDLGIVAFQPDDIWIIKGGPEARRRYLDEVIGGLKAGYRETTKEYQRILRQRNEALRAVRKGLKGREYARSWNPLLFEKGREIVQERTGAVEEIAEKLMELGWAWGIQEIGLKYYTSMGDDLQDEQRTMARIKRLEEAEIRRGTTLVGPHRDDVTVHQDERNARRECSQGEQKLMAIMLRIVQASLLRNDTGGEALLLMDDCLSELDSGNRKLLLGELGKWKQVALTTTDDAAELDHAWKIMLQ